jgi:hypothetical protein
MGDQLEESKKYFKISSDLDYLFEQNLKDIHDYNLKIKSKFNINYLLIFALGIGIVIGILI